MAWARFGDVVLAESDAIVSIEGVAYFPRDSVNMALLEKTATRTTCPWRGIASYFTVRAGETEVVDAAFSYENPKKRARRIAGWVGFWKGIQVEGAEE